ncbi:putative transcriptional regulator, AraC family [Pseudomonas knackmussii B13]|uniref:Putative transcriptional regulator, AraC family n=1 Tax=Pseudomonas knackmussii (strain DSM 6978 / CCUG 54928 / LMG 23759 / B13) TaxID=1301098 RepID=A0A024HCG3_PSEKB|nr:putative transcriptional regulator, AraC family [Pseudomonas knackmussii B13]
MQWLYDGERSLYPTAPLCGILCAMQPITPPYADSPLTDSTRDVVQRYHQSWKQRDLDAALALYHADVEYNDYFQNRCMRLAELRAYVSQTMPSRPDEFLDHIDRIRVDGDTAFIQYRTAITLSGRLAVFHSSEAITVRDGRIWRINEYATLVREEASGGTRSGNDARPPASRLGLSPRQLSQLAGDLEEYFDKAQPYLAADLDLSQVASATGYTRNQISYLLNQVMGLSFYQYVNQQRLQHLLGQLRPGQDARIDELAFSAGFNSLSAFYRCFRQHTGVSPREYLKRLETP